MLTLRMAQGIKKAINKVSAKEYVMEGFLEPGLVSYQDVDGGVCRLDKETIDKMLPSFIGCPVTIDHVEESKEEILNGTDTAVKEKKRGTVTKAWWNAETGKYDCSFTVEGQDAAEAVLNGYSGSCAYNVTETGPGGELHAMKYNETILDGEFEHLALVTNPRYEDCRIKLNGRVRMNSKAGEIKLTNSTKTFCPACNKEVSLMVEKVGPDRGKPICQECGGPVQHPKEKAKENAKYTVTAIPDNYGTQFYYVIDPHGKKASAGYRRREEAEAEAKEAERRMAGTIENAMDNYFFTTNGERFRIYIKKTASGKWIAEAKDKSGATVHTTPEQNQEAEAGFAAESMLYLQTRNGKENAAKCSICKKPVSTGERNPDVDYCDGHTQAEWDATKQNAQETEEYKAMFAKEKKEHPELSDETIKKIVLDHVKEKNKSMDGDRFYDSKGTITLKNAINWVVGDRAEFNTVGYGVQKGVIQSISGNKAMLKIMKGQWAGQTKECDLDYLDTTGLWNAIQRGDSVHIMTSAAGVPHGTAGVVMRVAGTTLTVRTIKGDATVREGEVELIRESREFDNGKVTLKNANPKQMAEGILQDINPAQITESACVNWALEMGYTKAEGQQAWQIIFREMREMNSKGDKMGVITLKNALRSIGLVFQDQTSAEAMKREFEQNIGDRNRDPKVTVRKESYGWYVGFNKLDEEELDLIKTVAVQKGGKVQFTGS